MSRTYKDQPDWVKANRTGRKKLRHHSLCEENLEGHGYWSERVCVDNKPAEWYLKEVVVRVFNNETLWYEDRSIYKWVFEPRIEKTYQSYFVESNRPCDLADNYNSGGWGGRTKCYFYYDYWGSYYRYWYGNPGRKIRRDLYYQPERRNTRNSLNEAKKDYNTNGDTDIEPEFAIRNPHGPWPGGYWD